MKNLKIMLVLTGLLLPFWSIGQTVMYDVIVAGRVIGSVKVMLYEAGAKSIKRRIEAEFSIPFYSGTFFSENDFSDGFLQTSLTEHYVNGKQRERTLTSNQKPQLYRIDFSGKGEKKPKPQDLNYAIHHTITNLYYEEPAHVGTVYSERYGQMCAVKKLDENRYGINLPNGKQSIYAYKHGLCTEVQSELAGMKLRIVRRWNHLAGN